jgi:hypothetical protein
VSVWVGWARHRYLVAAALFAVVVVLRLPFATTHLWAWDSVLYARALEQGFHVSADPAASRPHPPGYIWYVGAAAVARAFVGDSNAALVLVSILASAAGAALLFLIAARYVRTSIALLIALAYAVSPLTWLYSEVAYPYTVLALVSLALGALFLARRSPVVASLAFGVASGARQDVLLLLAPLWLWSIHPRDARSLLRSAGLVAVGALTWIVPSIALSGGPDEYAAGLFLQTGIVAGTYSAPARGLPALVYNAGFTIEALAWGLGLLVIPLALHAWRATRRAWRERELRPHGPAVGFALWIAPALAFYAVVHIGEWGYVLSILPALLLGAAIALERWVPPHPGPRWGLAGVASVVLPAAIFLAGDDAYKAVVGGAEFSAAALARHDARMSADVSYVRRHFAPANTLIVTREDQQLVRYYLPEYRAFYWDPDPYLNQVTRRRMMRPLNVVVLTPGLQPLLQGDVRRVEVAPGVFVSSVALERGSVLELRGERYTVQDTLAQ